MHVWNIYEVTIKNQPKTFNVFDRKFSDNVGRQHSYPFGEELLQKLNVESDPT